MKKTFFGKTPKPFVIPEDIKFINIDLATGKPSNQNYITESFKNNFNFDINANNDDKDEEFDLKGFY